VGREPSSDRVIDLHFTTDVPMYRRSYRLTALEKVTGRYRPLAKANQGISGQNAAVSCAKNPAYKVENEVENTYDAKS
jgi:hypothetical protein